MSLNIFIVKIEFKTDQIAIGLIKTILLANYLIFSNKKVADLEEKFNALKLDQSKKLKTEISTR